jgi:tRNA(Ile)-lysidine synthase TilS/MesJ
LVGEESGGLERGLTERTGLAISGGVDSMALASLYTRALKRNRSLPQAHGFIVDHKARPESTEEAAWVAEQLRSQCEPANATSCQEY